MSAGTVYENFFPKEKNSIFFPILCDCLLPAKFFARVPKTAIYVSVGVFGEKHFLKYIYNLSHFFRTLIQKTLSRKENFFPGCHNCNPHVQRLFLRKSNFFRKKFCLFICFGVWATFFVYWQKKVRVSKKQPTNTEKKLEEKICGKFVFLNHFRISRRKVWTIIQKKTRKIVKIPFKNVQRDIFRTFLWNEETLLKVFGRWAKLLNFWREFFVKFLKTAAYACSGLFWGSVGEKQNSLIVFGLWAEFAIFWQKISAGC